MKTTTHCPECADGTLHEVIEDYEVRTRDGNRVTVPSVALLRCDHCGMMLVPAASSRRISQMQAEAAEQLTRKELHAIFERSDATQKEFAEALGLGEKTFHRWLRGTQVISRSMGYYLRAVDRFPEVMKWIKNRGWRGEEVATQTFTATVQVADFPALRRRNAGRVTRLGSNPARRFAEGAIHCCG